MDLARGHDKAQFLLHAQAALSAVYSFIPEEIREKQGRLQCGYICALLYDERSTYGILLLHQFLTTAPINSVPFDVIGRYEKDSLEKTRRLVRHAGEGHVSSFESRNSHWRHFPGAIRAGEYAIGFSGFHPLYDESLSLLAAIKSGLHTAEKAVEIAKISDNQNFQKILQQQDLLLAKYEGMQS